MPGPFGRNLLQPTKNRAKVHYHQLNLPGITTKTIFNIKSHSHHVILAYFMDMVKLLPAAFAMFQGH